MTADATAPVAKPTVPAEEFAERRRRAAAAARARGLAGLLVCSRGGGTLDRYADVLYLKNFYTHFPFIPDFEGTWSEIGRASCRERV